MNAINDTIDIDKAKCRVMDMTQLMYFLRFNTQIFWSWGASAFTTNHDKTMFRMFVRGHHHVGHVYIFLSGVDLFEVYLTTLKGKIVKVSEGLYNDQLQDWIDVNIEKMGDYVF